MSQHLFGEEKLKELYVKGVFRNVMMLLTNAHPEVTLDVIDATGRSKPNRGSVSYQLILYLFQNTTLKTLIQRFLLSKFKSPKQGNASLHDLGLAHALFCSIEQELNPNSSKRDLTVTRTQSFGRVIHPLRILTSTVFESLELSKMPTLTDAEIESQFGVECRKLSSQLNAAISMTSKFRKTNRRHKNPADKTSPSNTETLATSTRPIVNSTNSTNDFATWFTVTRLVKHFALLKSVGLDQRGFDSFLGEDW